MVLRLRSLARRVTAPRRRVVLAAALALLLLIVIAVPVTTTVLGDRLAERLTARLSCRLGASPGTVRATVDAAPTAVLTGLVTGRLPRIDVALTVPFETLPAQVGGHEVRYGAGRDGLLAVRTTAQLRGLSLPVTVLARPTVTDGRLTLAPQEVEVLGMRRPAGALGHKLSGALPADGLARDLPSLPDGLDYRTVTATDTGLRLELTGTDLPLDRDRLGSAGTRTCPAVGADR